MLSQLSLPTDTGGTVLQVRVIPVTPFVQNCSVLICERSRRAAVLDPGGEPERIREVLREEGAVAEKILVTHGHLDHVGAVAELQDRLAVAVEGPQREDRFWIEGVSEQARRFGFPPARPFAPDRWLEDGDRVRVGTSTLEVRHCPGHTPGHVIFFAPESRLAFVGDVLFRGSIGRTDLPRGDFDQLIRSIHERLLPLGDTVTFVPGHGPASTLGQERQTNPFLLRTPGSAPPR